MLTTGRWHAANVASHNIWELVKIALTNQIFYLNVIECLLFQTRSMCQVRNSTCWVSSLFLCRLSCCGITEAGCTFLASALRTNPSHLRELDLSFNHPGESGVRLLSELLQDPACKMEKLKLVSQSSSWLCFQWQALCPSQGVLTPWKLELGKKKVN